MALLVPRTRFAAAQPSPRPTSGVLTRVSGRAIQTTTTLKKTPSAAPAPATPPTASTPPNTPAAPTPSAKPVTCKAGRPKATLKPPQAPSQDRAGTRIPRRGKRISIPSAPNSQGKEGNTVAPRKRSAAAQPSRRPTSGVLTRLSGRVTPSLKLTTRTSLICMRALSRRNCRRARAAVPLRRKVAATAIAVAAAALVLAAVVQTKARAQAAPAPAPGEAQAQVLAKAQAITGQRVRKKKRPSARAATG